MNIKSKQNSSRKPLKRLALILTLIVLLVVVVIVILEKTKTTDFIKMPGNKTPQQTQQAQTTSKQPSAQSSFTSGEARKEVTQSNSNEGTITPTTTQPTTPTSSADSWSKSADGSSVVVYSPIKDQVIKSGDILSGTSTASQVSFRLIDNISGVIARGVLNVKDGKYSGSFSFSTSATQGRVDVFTTDADGVESNNVSIPVRFQ